MHLRRASALLLLVFSVGAGACGSSPTPVIRPADMRGKTPDMTGQRPPDLSVVAGIDAAMQQDDAGVDDAAAPQDDLNIDDAFVRPDLRKVRDLSVVDLASVRDLSTPDLFVMRDFGVPPGVDLASPNCHLVVNELMTGTTQTGTEEFVEVYNQCPVALDLTGWTLVYRAGSNVKAADAAGDDAKLVTWAAGTMIPANGYLVYGGAGFAGRVDGTLVSGLKDGDGAVGIRDSKSMLVDSIGYTSAKSMIAAGNAFVETQAATAPLVVKSPGISIGRLPNGRDLNDNSSDFSGSTMITPGAENL